MKYDKDIAVRFFKEHGIDVWPEFQFTTGRRWRFDFVIAGVIPKVAVEVEGGIWRQGRHTRGSGFVKDMEKYNEAAALGWRILRVEPKNLCMQETVDLIKRALNHS